MQLYEYAEFIRLVDEFIDLLELENKKSNKVVIECMEYLIGIAINDFILITNNYLQIICGARQYKSLDLYAKRDKKVRKILETYNDVAGHRLF